ncbi:hypothetical protein ACTQ5H_09065 [Limosilactobacillus reuteri]|uniref:hypothetical protein n=1 Tax=Limosilactobacillus reuteri TaxID=1598 RepID=UPI003F991C22
MDLKDFCKSNYMNYLSKFERDFLVRNGRFNNVANVKKQLSKQFKNVSIRGRGKKAIIYIGKSKVVMNDKLNTLQDVLTISIIFHLDWISHSLSTWGRLVGMDTTFPNKVYIKTLSDDDKKIINWLATFVSIRRRNYFEKAYRKAVKAVGGTWSKIAMGKMTTGQTLRISYIPEQELAKLRKKLLQRKGVSPTKVREHEEYKRLLASYGYAYDWYAYLADYDQDNLDKIKKQGSQVTWSQVNQLFKAELLKDLKAEIDKRKMSDELTDLIDSGIMTRKQIENDLGVVWTALETGKMLDKWEDFRQKLVIDEPGSLSDEMKLISDEELPW